MEWLKRMTDAIEYMEENMEEPLDVQKVAKVACSSLFHFQRMFHMLTGYEHADAPEIEVYPEGDVSSPDYRCEIWVPIVKK